MADVAVVPWRDLIPRDGSLDDFPDGDRPALVRLESPGRDFEVMKQLLQAGEPGTSRSRNDGLAQPAVPQGPIAAAGLAARGFLPGVADCGTPSTSGRIFSRWAVRWPSPSLFDKNATAARLDGGRHPLPTIADFPCARHQPRARTVRERRYGARSRLAARQAQGGAARSGDAGARHRGGPAGDGRHAKRDRPRPRNAGRSRSAQGTVTVEVALDGALPRGARPDLSVDGTIEIERLPQRDARRPSRIRSGREHRRASFRIRPGRQADATSGRRKLGRSLGEYNRDHPGPRAATA